MTTLHDSSLFSPGGILHALGVATGFSKDYGLIKVFFIADDERALKSVSSFSPSSVISYIKTWNCQVFYCHSTSLPTPSYDWQTNVLLDKRNGSLAEMSALLQIITSNNTRAKVELVVVGETSFDYVHDYIALSGRKLTILPPSSDPSFDKALLAVFMRKK